MVKSSKRTLLYLVKNDQVLLAMKKRGFGAGKWNGTGGKLEHGEKLRDAAIRECQEEIGVTPTNFWQVAELDFIGGSNKNQWRNYVHIYLCDKWKGEPTESEEMAPKWFNYIELPIGDMWDADKIWLPKVLAGKNIAGKITFDESDNMANCELHEITTTV